MTMTLYAVPWDDSEKDFACRTYPTFEEAMAECQETFGFEPIVMTEDEEDGSEVITGYLWATPKPEGYGGDGDFILLRDSTIGQQLVRHFGEYDWDRYFGYCLEDDHQRIEREDEDS